MKRPLILLLAALWLALFPAAVLAPAPGAEEASGPPTTEQLAARERIRPKIEAIFADMKAEWDPNEDHSHYFPEATEAIVALGPEVVPFLVAEIELMDTQTYHYCAYALGRLGGPDAEAALRKAYRRSVDRGGPFGHAAERLALYGLAVMGKPDVVDLMQEGLPVQGLEMLPDLPLATQYAMLTAPGNVPNLLKQLETYKSDPEAVDKLRWTITALGRSGESSVAPKLLPFLDHASAPIRAAAAEALSRVGPPSVCNDLLAHLGDSHVKTNYVIVEALERMKPAQCLKGMISRLEVEPNLEVRAGLYRTLMAIQGETALESLRTGYARGGVIERALVIRYAGDLGSKKGLTLVRAALTDKSPEVVDAAVDALGDIGGPAAIDTLLALVTNPHRDIALNATKALVNLDEKRAGPRVASRLLEIVAEPVGDLTLRPPIVQYSEALVSLAFVDARDDIRKAADLQSDGEIREQLRSCARRLDRIATAGDDVAAWTSDLASPDGPARVLAAHRLAKIGSPAAIAALEAQFGRAETTDPARVDILRAIADERAAGAAGLVEQQLADPASDTWARQFVRRETAWAARRIGGERMIRALTASATRRDGRDWGTLVALALADPTGSADLLKRLRIVRLRYPESRFGREEGQIDAILSDLAHGVAPRDYDIPPDRLFEM